MRVTFRIYRTAKVPTRFLKGVVGMDIEEENEKVDKAIREQFGPHMAYGFRVFWPEAPGFKTTIVGMEAMAFEIGEPGGTPKAAEGIVTCDPISPEDTARIDGGLRCELQRLGVFTEADNYEWRGWYDIKPGRVPPDNNWRRHE